MSRWFELLVAVPLTVAAPAWAQEDTPAPSEQNEDEKPAEKKEDEAAAEKKQDEAPAEKKEAEKPAPKMSDKELGMAVWSAINATSGQIDACTERYTEEFKDAKGEAKVAFKVAGKGTPSDVNVTTGLESSDKLMKCLRDVGRRWAFPPKTNFDLSIDVKVAKGTKFVLLKPGEQPPPPPPGQPQSDEEPGFVSFTPKFDGDKEE